MPRAKKIIIHAVSCDAYQTSLKSYAQAEAESRKISAQIDLDILKIKEKYAKKLEELASTKEQSFACIQQYCEENKADLFQKKKSLDTPYGQIGFRLGTPKLKTLKGFTWASSLELIKHLLPEYVRVKEEPNKEALLAHREKIALSSVGLAVDADETFFIAIPEDDVR